MGRGLHVAVVGATGAVGQQMLETLEDRNFEIETLTLLSSKRSAGTKVTFKDEEYTVQEAVPESFEGVHIALFSAGGSVSQSLAPEAVKRGAIVIDNTSAFRMDENTPLVVPEVNEADLHQHNGIIANPNCSTIQMVAAIEPIRKAYGLKKVIVSTYQAVSGAGNEAAKELYSQTKAILNNEPIEPSIMPVKGDKKHYQIAFNAIPQIDKFQDNGYTFEEMKMINETKKIMHMPKLEVAATCVRLPIETGHSESVYIELDRDDATVEDIKQLLKEAPGVTLQDDPAEQLYPMPADCVGKRDVFVGRIRKDLDRANGFHLWVVSDNLLKGAAWNSVQIAESLQKLNLV
ncbi:MULTISPECIES: aspartate-semialdehyde dehydrogenase [Bacillus]|jgi:aspartate-semialdehyde dehydrogenase|uniref:Aspartate-semialdehyde dehydrogenase n=1 Tax=Bacillus amyloliquefaciens (strain ATCC 23350 / DSM 7 / BCRC 11601 / CCUG 28519 / NBRC 15535 / NRRL B-14393 / F) TaxID=692420 RepID=A0A9P1JGY4_BACAS|nr:aspartate-semialdehyde dehydrogenase [Bacillus amyloliquefaciens]AIW33678.1 aspartate-semialdehyde dehydrogenase [Bacillus subtilis]AEB23922.1 aspartate-semialdehyde dehydrogenase [Bacillus amyloliquefaciens TA208]AEB63374.1 aspartate-semialdehyde dehydrogenase [Bacillus amyloliquefaciens LL3]AEK88919.1 aspartate-semialdehyde dehydrogenase [Bacillus amyloliquefaciens XH7]ARW38951.1 Aspartate-semialdehyde dehydrogenase [Bacillus amyloliquefaciens]